MSQLTAGILDELWAPVVAVTAAHEGRANGLIASTALSASLLPEAPRVLVCLSRGSLTHDLALAAGALAVHLLPAEPIGSSLELVHVLGMRTGREEDKLTRFATRPGITGAPVLEDALGYVEARISSRLELDDLTVAVGDVVAEERLRAGDYLTIEILRSHLPGEWMAEWERRREVEVAAARLLRRR